MFDDQQSPKRELNLTRPLIVVACAGGGILLSFGLCGASAAISRSHSSSLNAAFGIAGLVALALSVLGFIAGCLWLVSAAIINAVRTRPGL